MSRKDRRWAEPVAEQPTPEPLVERERAIAPVVMARPARYVALTGLLYVNRSGERREAHISEFVDDLTDDDRDGFLARGAIEPEPDASINEDP